jgi:oligosaccharide repeat unit polymerase
MGPFVMIIGALNSLVLYTAINNFIIEKRITFETIGAFLLISLSASKSTYISLLLIYIIFWQLYYRIKLKKLILLIIGIFSVVYLSFSLYGEAGVKNFELNYFIERISDYFKEYDATQRVSDDFEYKFEYTWSLIYQTIEAPIPRAIWEGKPYVSYFHTYWKELYEPDVPIYHTTTYGCLSEAIMGFGIIGPIIYGLLFSQYVKFTERLRFNAKNYIDICISVNMIILIFFFVRSGFFFTTIWQLFITILIFKLLGNYYLKIV